jgi:hypothetical protein
MNSLSLYLNHLPGTDHALLYLFLFVCLLLIIPVLNFAIRSHRADKKAKAQEFLSRPIPKRPTYPSLYDPLSKPSSKPPTRPKFKTIRTRSGYSLKAWENDPLSKEGFSEGLTVHHSSPFIQRNNHGTTR